MVYGGLDILLVWYIGGFVSAMNVTNKVMQRFDLYIQLPDSKISRPAS
jgi:hypothetical protein